MVKKRDIEKVKEQVAEFKKLLVEKGYVDAKVLLFGSWSKGVARGESDIDVCVISDKFSKDRFDERVKLNIEASKINSLIEVTPMTPEDLEDKYSTIAMEVKKWGMVI